MGETVHRARRSCQLSLPHFLLCRALSVSSVALGRLYECCFCLGAARRLLGAWRLCPTSADDSILVWRDRHFSKLFFASRPASRTAGGQGGVSRGQGGVGRGLRIGCKQTDADSRVGGGIVLAQRTLLLLQRELGHDGGEVLPRTRVQRRRHQHLQALVEGYPKLLEQLLVEPASTAMHARPISARERQGAMDGGPGVRERAGGRTSGPDRPQPQSSTPSGCAGSRTTGRNAGPRGRLARSTRAARCGRGFAGGATLPATWAAGVATGSAAWSQPAHASVAAQLMTRRS